MNQISPGRYGSKPPSATSRLNWWYGALLFIVVVMVARLFYLQIIKHDYYQQQALNDQLKEYSITADRGIIQASSASGPVPIVLNETRYTLYADPLFIKKPSETAIKLASITSANAGEYEKLVKTPNTRYVVLAKRLSEEQKDKITTLKLPGVGTQAQNYRTYPQGGLAAQLLGFVNNDGDGTYGIEQYMNKDLAGKPGKLKAITDAQGIPLAASKNNIQINPIAGKDVVLTVDIAMQKQLENLLKQGLDKAKSKSGSALIIDPYSGAVKAMANYPSYNPAEYYNVKDAKLFENHAVSEPLEVGSVMKPLTASAALNLGVIKPDTTYYDPARWNLDGHAITNIEEDGGAGTRSLADILNLSINTGATWILMQMGGGQINSKARNTWHDYLVNHFRFSKLTGIEQGYESEGQVPNPDNGFALSLTYANTSFGQAMTATPLQMALAYSAVLNGGTYYQARLIDKTIDDSGKTTVKEPVVLKKNVVSPEVGPQMQSLLEYVVEKHNLRPPFSPSYSVGGKTGTAQIANPKGGYYADKFNGTYVGFVGGDKVQYVIAIEVNEPKIGGYAGSAAAQPIFSSLAHMLIDNFNVTPKSGT